MQESSCVKSLRINGLDLKIFFFSIILVLWSICLSEKQFFPLLIPKYQYNDDKTK